MLEYPISTKSPWTPEKTAFLVENYPQKGKLWCANALGMKEHQIRYKASQLGLRARGVSEAWIEKQKSHSKRLAGRKRPEQAAVMRRAVIDKGLHIQGEEIRKRTGAAVANRIASKGHPRGMAGKKHTEAARAKMSKSGLLRVASESADVKDARLMKALKTKAEKGNLVNPRTGTSWKAGWREIGGSRKYYRSKWEANYAHYLEWLKQGGHIKSWAHEPKTFWFEGVKRGCVSYLPDFHVVENDGSEAYHEVKGWMDARSATKIRRMAKYHPDVKLIVIDKKAYAELKKKVSVIVPGWEF